MRKRYNCFFLLLFLLSCQKKEEQKQPQVLDMKDYVTDKCSTCHSITRVFEKARKPEEWVGVVRRMGRCNPQFVNAEDQQKVLEYLVTNEFVKRDIPKEKADTATE